MGIFDFFKGKRHEEQKESKSIDQVLNEIQDESRYDDTEMLDTAQEEYENYEEDLAQEEYVEQDIIDFDIESLYNKLNNLENKYNRNSDIICLKALCKTSKNRENISAITEIIENLVKQYPNDENILNLLPSDQEDEISLDELVKKLEMKYSSTEIIMIKALIEDGNKNLIPDLSIEESRITKWMNQEKAVRKCLRKLLDKNPNDEDIINYLNNTTVEETIEKKLQMFTPEEYEDLIDEKATEELIDSCDDWSWMTFHHN